MDKNKNYLNIKRFCLEQGADLFGVADISEIRKDFAISPVLLEKLDKAICLGVGLSRGVLEEIMEAPTRLYFHHYKTANVFLDQLAFKAAKFIQKKGFLAIPIPASQILDWKNQKAHLSHKKLGSLAGLGWIGRNNLLVNKGFGSQFRLVTILTDLPARIDKTAKNDCGTCVSCIKVCPAGAIKQNHLEFDHIACFEKLKEFQKQRLVDQYICGVCARVCKGKT